MGSNLPVQPVVTSAIFTQSVPSITDPFPVCHTQTSRSLFHYEDFWCCSSSHWVL